MTSVVMTTVSMSNVFMTAVVMTNTAHPEKILVESEKILIQ